MSRWSHRVHRLRADSIDFARRCWRTTRRRTLAMLVLMTIHDAWPPLDGHELKAQNSPRLVAVDHVRPSPTTRHLGLA